MSMGWSWALFLANEAVASDVRGDDASVSALEFRDKLPLPQLYDHPAVASTHVDNIFDWGGSKGNVKQQCEYIDASFDKANIPIS
jgi:hypothetical protein